MERREDEEMGNTMTEHDLDIKTLQKGDEFIIQKWRDEFPLKDGMEGGSVELGDVYSDDTHFLVYKKDSDVAIGSIYLREIERGKSTEVILAIGDHRYMNKEVFRAIFRRAMRYLEESCPNRQTLFLIDIKSALQLMKGGN